MIAVKLAGCACVAAFAALWCASYASGLRRRVAALERVCRFAVFVAEQIGYYETPYPAIVGKFAAAEGIRADSAESAAALTVADIKPEKLARIGQALAADLDADDAARFLEFYSGVGAGFANAELRLCDEAKRYFEDRAATLRAGYAQKTRVRAALALFAAFSVCVLVW